jgi:hypothetical protein
MVPLLHFLIGMGNILLGKICDMIRAFFEKMSTGEVKLSRQIATYKIIIVDTVKERDEFDQTPNGKKLKLMQGMIKF